jgi:hypothetical protein
MVSVKINCNTLKTPDREEATVTTMTNNIKDAVIPPPAMSPIMACIPNGKVRAIRPDKMEYK